MSALTDPRVAFFAGATAAIMSEKVRHGVGKGLGYGLLGVKKVTAPAVHAGRDIVDEARDVAFAEHNGGKPAGRKKTAA